MAAGLAACSGGGAADADTSGPASPGPAAAALTPAPGVVVGAAQLPRYLPALLQGQRVGLVVNQTSRVGNTYLADTLKTLGVHLTAIFAPEHGFRGEAADGATITDGRDARTGVPVRSVYGKTKKPTPEMLADVDVLVFDIQDVGARFYTFISTLHYVMEAAAEQGKAVIVLDRPNPNGAVVDGPVLAAKHRSFVGLDPLPICHGLTVGELARMLNGEKWLAGGRHVPPHGGARGGRLHPRHALPPARAPLAQPAHGAGGGPHTPASACLRAPDVSVGRGTDRPFEVVGAPTPARHAALPVHAPPQRGLAYPPTQRPAVLRPRPAPAGSRRAGRVFYGALST